MSKILKTYPFLRIYLVYANNVHIIIFRVATMNASLFVCVENVEYDRNFLNICGKLIRYICYIKGERISSCAIGTAPSSIAHNANNESRVSINSFC